MRSVRKQNKLQGIFLYKNDTISVENLITEHMFEYNDYITITRRCQPVKRRNVGIQAICTIPVS